jgi:single-strand DNA-binding protein
VVQAFSLKWQPERLHHKRPIAHEPACAAVPQPESEPVMANFNRIVLLGNLTRDPQLKYLPSQTQVVEFGLAVNRKWRGEDGQDREEVMFIDCVCFGKGAEILNTYCQKGKPVLIEGRLKLDTWEDKQGGGKRSKHRVVVENFQLLGSRNDPNAAGGGGGGANYDSYDQGPPAQAPARPPVARPPAARPAAAPPRQQAPPDAPPPAEPPFGEEQQFTDDEIPF